MRSGRTNTGFALACVLLVGACTSGDTDTGDAAPTTSVPVATDAAPPATDAAPTTTSDGDLAADSPAAADPLAYVVADARALIEIDVAAIDDAHRLFASSATDPMLTGLGEGLVQRASTAAGLDVIERAWLYRSAEAADGVTMIADIGATPVDTLVDAMGLTPIDDADLGGAEWYDSAAGNVVARQENIIVSGEQSAVERALDSARGGASADTGVARFATDSDAHVAFAIELLGTDSTRDAPDRTLRAAEAMTGEISIDAAMMAGTVEFHTGNAAEFVESYNRLDRHAQGAAADPASAAITAEAPVVGDLDRVVVALPPSPVEPTAAELWESRNLFKKLFVGMDAHDYAERVGESGEDAWFDFLVKSPQDGDPVPSPASVYIRWEFKDDAAIAEFEANELPDGFRLAPTRFVETDDPAGEIFFALNLYNGGGGMIVGGARAEWDVFVHGPDGADPNAGERPRFMVVQALAEEVSADAGNLLTPAEPLSHQLVDGVVISDVRQIDETGEVQVFRSEFPVPETTPDNVARFTREMAIGNDYIYWRHGVSDRVLYNATTFNYDAYFVDTSAMSFVDNSRWAKYLKPEVKDAVYYENTLEYVASPMANLDSEYLDITPEWLDALRAFTNNGHQIGLMRKAVEQLFRGQGSALVPFEVSNETPSTYYHFPIADPDGLAAVLELPDGVTMTPLAVTVDGEVGYYLTLAVTALADAQGGTRAEWMVYTDRGTGRPTTTVVELMTEGAAFDSADVISLPDHVVHGLDGATITTQLAGAGIEFEASFDLGDAASAQPLSLDWIEAGDTVCSAIGVCDTRYYDAETLDVPAGVGVNVTIDSMVTPWDAFIDSEPHVVLTRENSQLYVAKRWANLQVPVAELPFAGLDDPTHTISGTGTLVGRTSDVGDSVYSYSGDGRLEGDQFTFAIDQEVDNALGIGNIYTTGTFDLTTGTGSQTVVDCIGPALLCSNINPGSWSFYTAERLTVSDGQVLDWAVDVTVDLGGSFGLADSSSTFSAQP